MSKTLEGMARCFEIASDNGTYDEEAMRGALLWLSKNVSDEMVESAWRAEFSRGGFDDPVWRRSIRSAISAALRAAGDGR